jgi:hypothetical protein
MSNVDASAVGCLHGKRLTSLPAGCNPGVPAAAPCRPCPVFLISTHAEQDHADLIAASGAAAGLKGHSWH